MGRFRDATAWEEGPSSATVRSRVPTHSPYTAQWNCAAALAADSGGRDRRVRERRCFAGVHAANAKEVRELGMELAGPNRLSRVHHLNAQQVAGLAA